MPEIFQENIIENNIMKCFSFHHKIQFILGSHRVLINKGVIELPKVQHNLYSLFWVFCSSLSEAYYQKFYLDEFFNKSKMSYYTCFLGTAIVYLTYVGSLYLSRFINVDLNVKIYVMLQKLDRILFLTADRYYTDFQSRLINLIIVFQIVNFLIGFGLHTKSLMDKPWYTIFLALSLVSVYMDCFLYGSLLHFITVRLNIFNKMMKNFIMSFENKESRQKPPKTALQVILSHFYPSFDHVDGILEPGSWLECVHVILKSHETINEIYNHQIMMLIITVFVWILVGTGAMTAGLQSGLYPFVATLTIAAWAVAYYVQLTSLAVMNDMFLYQIKSTKMLCVRVMFYNYDEQSRKAASQVLKMLHYADPKFVVGGIVEMGAGLALTLLAVIATNMVVVIQFISARD